MAAADEVSEGRGRGVWLDGVKVALFMENGRLYALADRCPHMGASLSEGSLCGGNVRCHWHGWCFDLQTGECRQKEWATLATYEVRVEDGRILLRARTARPPAGTKARADDLDEACLAWDPDPSRDS
ncbi:MAG: Rieske (2Fe-2S) protein [Acidobacteriota bacterium]